MHFRWSTRMYSLLRPVFGHRAAMFFSDMAPVALFVGMPLLLFVLIASLPTKDDGSRHESCGSGPGQYDC